MSDRLTIARWMDNRQNEIDGAHVYRTLAQLESQPQLVELYRRLAESEEQHATFWEGKIGQAGGSFKPRRPTLRARALTWLARRFGPAFIVPTLAMREQADRNGYDNQPEAREAKLANAEHSHARLLVEVAGGNQAGMEGGVLARLEGRHRSIGGNALRAAVLGANDGLVSNLSLVMGVAGAAVESQTILITGLAGLLAGACSMAMGEWLSVRSSRELAERQVAIEAEELREAPEEEAHELSLIYQAKGLPPEDAAALAKKLIADEKTALETLTREELGLDPEELGGSAWEAAISSFALFVVGAIFPVLPFFFMTGYASILTSIAVSTLALFAIGAAITLMTGRGVVFSGMRQVLIGLAAAGVTFGIGRLIGVSLGG